MNGRGRWQKNEQAEIGFNAIGTFGRYMPRIMKKLAIVGASYLQQPLVEKANEMGIETHCFAWPEGAVCKDIAHYFYPVSVLDKEAILERCRQIGIDGITTIATDIAMPAISYVATQMGLTGNTIQSAEAATNKWKMREAFSLAGCSIPKYQQITASGYEFPEMAFPVIVKPVDRSGSRGVSKVNDSVLIAQAIDMAIAESLTNAAIVEEYIEGDEVSVESISWEGRHYILAITDKVTTGPPHFVELAHHQPTSINEDLQEAVIAETIKALNALNVEYGAGHTELKITPDGKVYIIEVGARMGGDFIGSHLVKLSCGYDFVKGVIDAALGQFTIPEGAENNFSGVFFLSKETEFIMPYFYELQEYDIEKKITSDVLHNATNSNDRSGYLIYKSSKKVDLYNGRI